jgi:GTPase
MSNSNEQIMKDIGYIPEIRIGVIGNVDSGKSTTIGVLTHHIKDDGRGSARELIMVHNHEKESGRTSAIAHSYIRHKDKTINLMDLAGHEKYFKTTVHGICGSLVNYAMLIINANTGISGMTSEHVGLILSLKVRFYVVYTKIDMTPKNVYDRNLEVIKKFIENRLKKKMLLVGGDTILDNILDDHDIIPIFPTSNVIGDTPDSKIGTGISKLKNFIEVLPFDNSIVEKIDMKTNIIIDRTYQVPGIGLVLSGIVETGKIKKGDVKMLGPFDGKYYSVRVRSIHNNFREEINVVYAGQSCCMSIKSESNKFKLERYKIKRGFRLMDEGNCYNKFDAKIKILHHPSTITKKYQPTIHCGSVTQTVKIEKMNKDELRTGDEAIVTLKFIRNPAYIEIGKRFIFRDGRTKGFGIITEVCSD